jgi:hypothetical protein
MQYLHRSAFPLKLERFSLYNCTRTLDLDDARWLARSSKKVAFTAYAGSDPVIVLLPVGVQSTWAYVILEYGVPGSSLPIMAVTAFFPLYGSFPSTEYIVPGTPAPQRRTEL